MKGRFAVIPVLLLALSREASTANNLDDAAREMARRIASFAGKGEAVALTFRNLTSLPASEAARARTLVEAALREAGVRVEAQGQAETRVTLSENASRFLLAGEARREEERGQWVVSWPRAATGPDRRNRLTLEKKLLWEQDEAILDAAQAGDSLLVLSPSRIASYARREGGWEERGALSLALPRRWPRDPRGRIQVRGTALGLFLPGAGCVGSWQPALALECKPGDEPWALDAGGRYLLLAAFTEGRNHFNGKIITQTGARRSVAPFYAAAAVEEAGGPLWLFAGVNGRVTSVGRDGEPAGIAGAAWGSDIATVDDCRPGQAVLVTRPSDQSEAVQAFAIVNRQAEPISQPVAMPGPVTALWPSPGGAVAVARDGNSGKYGAYLLTTSCGP